MHGQRGQTLPLTLGGIIAILVFGFFALNYANTLRWQIRAQNAADSAAQAILALQTQQFNEMNAVLYSTAVEEYRIRHLLNALVLVSHGQGGCVYSVAGLNGPLGCVTIERDLEGQFDAAVGRYTGDVLTLHRVTAPLTLDNIKRDATALLAQIGTCTSALGGDCAFKYGTPLLIAPRTDMEAVYMDANGILKPSPGTNTPLALSVSTATSPRLNTQLFAPLEVEVYACATVPSLIPSFLGWTFAPFTAVARGAATAAMVEEDWLQPGTIQNPFSKTAYQPKENYLSGTTLPDANGYDWYNLNFGGNGVVAVAGQGFINTVTTDEFSVYLGWWNSIPIHPFGGAKSTAAMGCAS